MAYELRKRGQLVDTVAAPAVKQLTSPVLVELDPAGTDVP